MRIVSHGMAITLAVLTLAGNALAAPVETILYSFKGGSDGVGPFAGLITDKEGAPAAVGDLVSQASSSPRTGAFTTVVGIVTLLIGASGVFRSLKDALNTIWEVPQQPAEGHLASAWGVARKQLLAVVMVLAVGFLLVLSLVAGSVVSTIERLAENVVPVAPGLLRLGDLGVFLLLFSVLFALTFRVLPDRDVTWGEVWLGATVTGLLFTVGRFGISLYLSLGGPTSLQGAVGSLLVLLLWVYYSAQIYLLGAELTYVYATRYRRARRT